MARPEVTGRKSGAVALNRAPAPKDEDPPPPRLAFSIKQFCAAHAISEAFYYKLKRQKKNPREMKIGARTIISVEAATDWRREREAASTANADQIGA
jgi:hypothetical protein